MIHLQENYCLKTQTNTIKTNKD